MSGTAVINDVIPRSDILKRAARIGAEILNIKLSGDLPDQTVSAITRVLHEHKVIFSVTKVISMTRSRSALPFA